MKRMKYYFSLFLCVVLVTSGLGVNVEAKAAKKYVKSIQVTKSATIIIPANRSTATKTYQVKVKVKGKVSKKFKAVSGNKSVATVKVKGSKIKVTAKKAGTAKIKISTKAKGKKNKKLHKTLKLTVKKVKVVPAPPMPNDNPVAPVGSLSHKGYELEQVVVMSRHNIRSPLSSGDSVLGTITPHSWFQWSSNPSELSLRGGVLETEMGQYFRKWMESEKLIPENYHPEDGAVRIYANSKQRTIATARYFTSGLLPTSKTEVETHMEFDVMDPVFTPQLTYVSPAYKEDAEKQIWEMYTNTINSLEDNYQLLTNVIDMKNSKAWKEGTVSEFRTDDTELVLEPYKEPGMKGSLKTACSVSDALVLQYYEAPSVLQAAFGHSLNYHAWKQISEVKDVYGDVLFTAPLIATNVAHPLLQEIQKELSTEGRKFTFLCGHDSNIGSILAALGAKDYELPGAIEAKTPIGSKIVFSRWKDKEGKAFCTVDLVYQTTEQLRNISLLDLQSHPSIVPMQFEGIQANEDGLYQESDFMNLLQNSIEQYNDMITKYDN